MPAIASAMAVPQSRDPAGGQSKFSTRASIPFAQIADALRQGGDLFFPFEKRALELRYRLASGTFRLAVVGQCKRGKSAFVNALLRQDLFSCSAVPIETSAADDRRKNRLRS